MHLDHNYIYYKLAGHRWRITRNHKADKFRKAYLTGGWIYKEDPSNYLFDKPSVSSETGPKSYLLFNVIKQT